MISNPTDTIGNGQVAALGERHDSLRHTRSWCWDVEKWALGPFARDQVVIQRSSGEAVRLVDLNGLTGYYQVDSGDWVPVEDLEDPLREGRLRDLASAREETRRREAVARGDLSALFPSLRGAGSVGEEAPRLTPVLLRLLLLHVMVVLGLVLSSLLAPQPRPLPPRPAPPAVGADRGPVETSASDSGPGTPARPGS